MRKIRRGTPRNKFLLYSPLNQGLKHQEQVYDKVSNCLFLLYSPLNQGLKLYRAIAFGQCGSGFLLYSPLNQGLKLWKYPKVITYTRSFYSTVH